VTIHTASDFVFTLPSQDSAGVATDIRFHARLFSLTQVVPLLRTDSVLPHLPLKLPHVSQVFFQQLANPHVIQAGWVWDEGETVDVCIHGQSLKGVQVKRESTWGGS